MRHGRFGFLGICTTSLLTVFIAYKKSTAAAVPLCFSAYTIAQVVCEIL